jgi:membrane protein implicated in regulation of membrane protease activity
VPVWLIWLVAAGVFGSAEALSGDFVLIMCGAGAGAGAVTAAGGAPPAVQIVVAVALAPGLVGFLRPVAKRHLLFGCGHQSGGAALVGKPAIVPVEVDDRDGRGEIYPAGAAVRMMQVCRAAAVVYDESSSS